MLLIRNYSTDIETFPLQPLAETSNSYRWSSTHITHAITANYIAEPPPRNEIINTDVLITITYVYGLQA